MGVGKCGSCAGKDHALTRGDLSGVAPTHGGSAPCSNAWGDWAEVSRRHSSEIFLMKRRPEAKRGVRPLCSALSFDRQVNLRCRRRDDGTVFPTINQPGSLEIGWSDYGSTFLVTARCGPACRVVWEGGGLKPPSYPSYAALSHCPVTYRPPLVRMDRLEALLPSRDRCSV